MSGSILGIHHVTGIASDPQANVNFYADVLGQRLVKRTVNFDDPGTYHLYYGDEVGHPGTAMTFFPYPGARRGIRGTGQATVTAYSIPVNAVGYWLDRLDAHQIPHEPPLSRLGHEIIRFHDPDDLELELVAQAATDDQYVWRDGPIPAECAIRGFYGVTLAESDCTRTIDLLTRTMGFAVVAEDPDHIRLRIGDGPGAVVDLLCQPNIPPGRVAAGSVHHVAWRVADDVTQLEWRERLVARGLNVTEVKDRQYFHSIYFREPGGVLFEIATDGPGFTLDEDVTRLGSVLKLPPWLENQRVDLVRKLLPLRVG